MKARTKRKGEFHHARDLAHTAGLELHRHAGEHYTIVGDGWRIELYPETQRIHIDGRTAPPFKFYPYRPWTLTSAVRAATSKLLRDARR